MPDDGTEGYGLGLLLGAERIARELGIAASETRYLLREGYLPGHKIGARWAVTRDELQQSIRTATIPASASA